MKNHFTIVKKTKQLVTYLLQPLEFSPVCLLIKSLPFVGIALLVLSGCKNIDDEANVLPTKIDSSATGVSSFRLEEAFPEKTGILKKGYLFGEPIEYEEINGQAVFQGDIILRPEQISETPQPPNSKNGRMEGAGKRYDRWPNNIVYYEIDPKLPNQQRVLDAIQHWETYTAVRFVRKARPNYVIFKPGDGCSSEIGMQDHFYGMQFIKLSDSCTTGNVIHEIGHTLGLFHEQTRWDRDKELNIHWHNIKSGKKHNFEKYSIFEFGFDHGTLDVNSIMMYGSTYFSRNGLPTITRKDGSTFNAQRDALSEGDVAISNVMYPYKWFHHAGGIKDIDVGANGSMYVISNIAASGGYKIYKYGFNGSTWALSTMPGSAVKIAVGPQGVPWIINSEGKMWRWKASIAGWRRIPGTAKDIDIGADGSVYIISTSDRIHKWNEAAWNWTQLDGSAVRVAVGPNGIPWVVTSSGRIYRRNAFNTAWVQLPGRAKAIDIGANGIVYVLGTSSTTGGYKIYKLNKVDDSLYLTGGAPVWYPVNGGAVELSVSYNGMPWIINNSNTLYTFNGRSIPDTGNL